VVEPVKDEGASPQRVINLMDALRASIGTETQKKPAAASTKVRGAERRSGRSTQPHRSEGGTSKKMLR
jgi:non-homologous end joining protein Ku